jgi:hypothetical protein
MFCPNCPTPHTQVVRAPHSCSASCGKLIPAYNKFCPECSNRTGKCEQCGHQESAAEKAARHQYVDGLLARGEAAERDAGGNLPLHATHEITGYDSDGKPYVRRVRMH